MPNKKEKTGYGISPIIALPFLMTVGTILGVWLKGKNAKTEEEGSEFKPTHAKPTDMKPAETDAKPTDMKPAETELKPIEKPVNDVIAFNNKIEAEKVRIDIKDLAVPTVTVRENNPHVAKTTNKFDFCYEGNNPGKPIHRLSSMWLEITTLLSKSNPTVASMIKKGNFKAITSGMGLTIAKDKEESKISLFGIDELLTQFKISDRYDDILPALMPENPNDDFLVTFPIMVQDVNLQKYRFRLIPTAIYFDATARNMYIRIFDLRGDAGNGASEIIKSKMLEQFWLPYFFEKVYKKKFQFGTSVLKENYLEKYDNINLCGLFPLLVYHTYLAGSKEFWRNSATTMLDRITTDIKCGDDAHPLHCKSMKKIVDQINTHSVQIFQEDREGFKSVAPPDVPDSDDEDDAPKAGQTPPPAVAPTPPPAAVPTPPAAKPKKTPKKRGNRPWTDGGG